MSALRLPGFRWRFGLLFGVGLAALSAMAEAQEVTLSAQGASGDLVDRLRGTSLLLRPSEDGTARSGQDIVAAARSDYGRLIGVLYEAGYFAPIINIRLDGRDAARLSPFSAPARVDRIQIDIATGAPFRLGQAQIAPLAGNTELPEGFRPGGAASTPLLRETTEAGLDGWRNQGHALADVGSQRITARNREAVLNVDVTLDPGPVVTFGNLLPQGHERMRPERIIAIAGLPTGEIYSPAALERVEERLRDTGVFSAVSLETQPLRAGDVMDYAAIIDEAPLRRLGFGVELSSSDGSAVSTYWLHRNLLGGGERLRFDASVAGIGTGDGRPDIELGARLDRPATFTADTTLNLTLDGAWLDEPLYELASIAAGIGVEHWISRTTTARAGITITQSEIDDALGNRSVTLATLPIGVTYDNRDNPLDARAGAFGELELAPFLAFGGEGGARMTLDARAYRGFGASDRTRLAGRFQLGTITGADITDIPPDALFYSGGSGTVRGQDFQALGALQNGVASGGRSFLGLSGELRHDIGDTDFGVVGFADFGLITTDDFGGGASDYHAGAGFGLRYDTPFGPIRIDLGTPASDGRFGQELFLYIGIGQAFLMRRAAIPLAFGLAMSVTPAALAQENAEADGTRLERFLEEQLSAGDGFDVDLTGFRGALSSAAQLERLTISDAEGEWLILEEAQLEWTRSALLRGVLDVQALTAERLQVLRTPLPASGPDLRPAEATPFALPELPVEIQIAEVAIAELSLGEPILGQAAQFSFQGSASLAEGDGHANLELIRQDGPQGVFDLDTRYTNTTRELSLSLSLEEAAGGLISDLLNLPDRPALSLSANGSGPITDFTADIALASNGTPRFGGQVTSRSQTETGDHVIAVDLGGDISPLVIADYRDFFGDDVTLQSQVTLFEDGRIALEGLSLRSAALSLSGDVALRADGHPQAFHLTGRLADPNAPSVRLPIPNQDLRIGAADLDIFFDAAEGERVSGQFLVQGLDADTLSIAQISAEIAGAITEQDGAVSAVVASLSADTQGLRHRDPALSQALGEDHSLRSDLSWIEGAPVFLTNLDLRAGDVALTGAASVAASGMAVQIALGVDAIAEDLTRFAAVAGQTLAGSVTGSLEGQIEALSGAFDLTLTGTGRDLEIVEGLPSELLAGDTTLTLQARRDETGISLEALNLDAAELDLEAQGRLSADLGALVANVELANLGRFVPVVPGPVSARLSLERQGSDPWQTQAQIDGPAGVTVALQGLVGLPNGHVDLTANGQLPLALANRAIAPRSVSGNLGFDLALSGAPEIAGLSGQFSASGVRVALPTIQTALESVSLSGGLSNGAVSTVLSGRIGTGGQVQADARVSLLDPGLPAQITIQGRDLRLVDPTLYETRITSADLTYAGNLTGSAQVSGTITLGETELRVPETGLGTAQIPQITHIGESFAERQTRIAAGLVQTGSGSAVGNLGLDLTITAPGRVFLRGRGLDAELGGTLRLGGTSANVIPAGRFDLIRGRLSILGTRLDLSEGSATLQGNFDPFIRLLASSRTPGYRIDVGLIGLISAPEISFSSDPALPEDEVLAQLLFGRSVSALSPVQLLQLADAAAGLAGGSSQSGIFASLREGTGLDDLDFQTDETGNAAVRAGRYLSNNVYTDLTLGASGETDLSLNIDLTDNITARGSFSSDGDSSVGVFFERDY